MIGLRKKKKTPLKIGLQKKRETRVEEKKKTHLRLRERERERDSCQTTSKLWKSIEVKYFLI